MLKPTSHLLDAARGGGYAIGTYNICGLEGVRAVVAAAEATHSDPVATKVELFGAAGRA